MEDRPGVKGNRNAMISLREIQSRGTRKICMENPTKSSVKNYPREARRAPPPRPSPTLRNPTGTSPPRGAPRLTNWLLRHTCFCLLRAANSEGSPLDRLSRFSELRVASGFAVRAITGASIGLRDWERIPNLVHAFLSLFLFLSLSFSPSLSLFLCPSPWPSISVVPSFGPSLSFGYGQQV